MNQNKSMTWKKDIENTLIERIETCKKCDLYKTRTKSVPGTGCLDAEVMFVGEGPGKNEDLTGEPFVGQAGKVLDQLLESIGLSREQIFIGNTVKCRPPGNRTPSTSEMEACKPYLVSQIELIQPKVIVVLGSAALASLFGSGKSISRARGKLMIVNGICYFPTYHPAAALYRRTTLELIMEDFSKLKEIVQNRKRKNEN